ncbi:MAG: cation diffusion facilitator family transporter [Thermoleophilia bacterium]|nr:cation diffusion facilitator family transporter [Thermoleophilia bacterium]
MHASPPDDGSHRQQRRVALASIVAALLLVAIKLSAGAASGSLGLLAEALHSGADLIAAVLTFIAIRVGQRPPDRRHPWGHGRAEHLAALAESIILLLATAYISYEAIHRLVTGTHVPTVGGWLIGVALVVIAIDAWRTVVSHRAAAVHGSPALASNALHFASDLAGSIAVFAGLALVALGFGPGDSIAALVVAAIVAFNAWRLLWDNAQVLMDVAPEAAERTATRAIDSLDLPITLRRLRIRRSAGSYLADVVIGVSATDHVGQGHALADAVEDAVERALPGSDVVVHVEPDERSATLRDRVTAAALAHPGIHEVHNVRVLLIDGVPEVSLHLKVRPDMRLDAAHDLADRVEDDIRAGVPELTHVDVHIEPVDVHASVAGTVDDDAAVRSAASEAAFEVTGRDTVDVRVRRTQRGLVAAVTVLAAGDQTLSDAHVLATRVEERLGELVPELVDVVVHTEPAPPQDPPG